MAPVKRRRGLPTLIDRGLGLLEVIFPRGSPGRLEPPLPPGRRDPAGFWFPAGYQRPADIFTPQQRVLQAKQRLVQRVRTRFRKRPPAPPFDAPAPRAEVATMASSEVSLPLPPPFLDAPETDEPRRPIVRSNLASASVSPGGPAGLPAEARVVDSRKGSD